MQGFAAEWQKALSLLRSFTIASIYFGGGTPSLLGPSNIEKILSWIQPSSDIEITLEANPENSTLELMRDYRMAGINRLSIGAQSFEDSHLLQLGRTHNKDKISTAILQAVDAGIANISIDLMYDLPDQTLSQWKNTLAKATDLPISHLSLYNLTIEPHTIFYKKRKQLTFPDPEISLAMYIAAIEHFEKNGFKQYEISAFAKPGKQSVHNVGYWKARPFLGFGPSAFSYWEGRRFQNIPHLRKYYELLMADKSPIHFDEKLEKEASQRELLAIQLRLLEGVDTEDFQKKHGSLQKNIFKDLDDLVHKQWLTSENHIYRLTTEGMLFYDSLATHLI